MKTSINNSSNYLHLFTINDIEEMATNSSFERGEDIFIAKDVQNITKIGNRFEAIVYGSRQYEVCLINNKDKLHLDCNCPYSFGGICKHLVAFALKILAGDYQEIEQEILPALSDNKFQNEYLKITSKKKLFFLKQLLDRDDDLKQQFIAFSKDKTEKLDNILGEKLDDIKLEINSKLSNIDFDNLQYNYDDHSYGYRDYWEVEYDTAIDEIKIKIDPYINSVTNYIKKGNLLDAIRILLGLYEGVQNLPDLDSENCIFDGEYNNDVRTILNESIRDISNMINNIVISDKAILEVLTLIFERISFYSNQKPPNEENINYSMDEFELLFQSLTINSEIAIFLHKELTKSSLESLASAYILLNIAKVSNNEKAWLETAETYASSDSQITQQLLDKYNSKKLYSDFNRIAKMALENWVHIFDKYLVDHLDKEQQEELFVKALKNYVSDKCNVKYYHILKTYLSKEETVTYVDKFKESYESIFYVQLLEIEKRFKEILIYVNKNKDSYELKKLIKPILNIYPLDCFSIIVAVNIKAMNGYKRNRGTYQTMVKTLKLLKQIPSKKNETDKFLESLYNHKPNLPALKDEMRKAKLITI